MDMTMREFFNRYGPALAFVVAFVVLIVLLPSKNGGQRIAAGGAAATAARGPTGGAPAAGVTTTRAGAVGAPSGTPLPGGATAPGGATPGAPAGASGVPAAGDAGVVPAGDAGAAAGAGSGTGSGAGGAPGAPSGGTSAGGAAIACRQDGRMPGISRYVPTCTQTVWAGDNGGSTYQGVTATQIKVVRYIPLSDPATDAVAQGLGAYDPPQDIDRISEVLRRYFNTHFETYGREVVFERVAASGPSDNDQTARADAAKIADEIKAFAVFSDIDPGNSTFVRELAARGVMCMCSVSEADSFYQATAPYVWTSLPTARLYYRHIAEYVGKRLAGRNARYAGDASAALKNAPRKFGLVYIEANKGKVNPGAREEKDVFVQELAGYGVELSEVSAYDFDFNKAQSDAANIIVKMKNKNVSTIIFFGDPLYPVFLTQAATQQAYFPEWMVTGTALTDTTFFGRTYDRAQWDRVYGISPLWVFFTNVEISDGYREYHHMRKDGSSEGVGVNVYRAPQQLLFIGVHMAGPNLTPQTFAQGMLNYPPTGATPSFPYVYFTQDNPAGIKDFTDVFWDPDGSGRDETGKDGVGILVKANLGQRYQLGQWPSEEPDKNEANAVFTTDNPPEGPNPEHEQDGHTHSDSQKCLSCA